MRKMKKIVALLMLLSLVFTLPPQGMQASAKTQKQVNLNVSKDGNKFTLTKGKKSYSFRYDWDEKQQKYSGYNANKISKMSSGKVSMISRDIDTSKNVSILISGEGATLNKKIYGGMSLASFHKKIKKAWGNGYYGYWDNAKNAAVKIGTKKPTNQFVKKRSKDTGMYWVGKRGNLALNISITWNSEKKQAEVVNWIEISRD